MGAGCYQTVNIVGVAVISGMVNTPDGQIFPKVFGSDGAGFAVPGAGVEATRETPAALQNRAEAEFAIILCATLVFVADIRAVGRDLRVSCFASCTGVDYAMFSGGGLP